MFYMSKHYYRSDICRSQLKILKLFITEAVKSNINQIFAEVSRLVKKKKILNRVNIWKITREKSCFQLNPNSKFKDMSPGRYKTRWNMRSMVVCSFVLLERCCALLFRDVFNTTSKHCPNSITRTHTLITSISTNC